MGVHLAGSSKEDPFFFLFKGLILAKATALIGSFPPGCHFHSLQAEEAHPTPHKNLPLNMVVHGQEALVVDAPSPPRWWSVGGKPT